MRKHKKLIIWAAAITALIVTGSMVMNHSKADKEALKIQENLTEVKSGDISDRISGTGVVTAEDTFDITAMVAGTVASSEFDEGESVREGDVLFTIDAKDLERQIKTAAIAVEKCEEIYHQSVAAGDDLATSSRYSGTIEKLYVSKGDYVTSGTKIADIKDNSSLILKIPFNTADIDKIYMGAAANISLLSNSAGLQGTVSRIYDSTESLEGYKMVTYIEITVRNPGAVGKGEKAYATVNGIGCNSAGEFINLVEKSIVSGGTGQIMELNIKEGESVKTGYTVLRLKNDQITNAISSSSLAVREAKNSLENLKSMLEDYKIKSPVSGIIVSKNIKKGDNVALGTVMMTVSDINNLYVDVEIDEIYIAKVKAGQNAIISADALQNRQFTGEVVRINDAGVAKNGVTYYPVRVRISESDTFKVGMNLSVDIIISTKENALLVPKDAVEGNKVLKYEDGRLTEIKIETGIKDNDYIEVLSGLKKGDKVSAKRGD